MTPSLAVLRFIIAATQVGPGLALGSGRPTRACRKTEASGRPWEAGLPYSRLPSAINHGAIGNNSSYWNRS